MRMSRRAVLHGACGKLKVSSVSTSAHTAVSIASLTWEELSLYSKAISADSGNTYSNSIRSVNFSDGATLGIGDYLNISIDGVNYQVDILGFHHDEVTDSSAYGGEYAGITWQMHDSYNTQYKMGNTSSGNSDGWKNCLMRTSTMTTLLGLLTSEISDVIVPVNKLTSEGDKSSTIDTTSDNLFLLSEIEIFGTLTYSFTGEGTRYSYYAAGGGSIKNKSSYAAQWWTRSPRSTSSSYYLYVNTSGAIAYTYPDRLYGVAFAFCT